MVDKSEEKLKAVPEEKVSIMSASTAYLVIAFFGALGTFYLIIKPEIEDLVRNSHDRQSQEMQYRHKEFEITMQFKKDIQDGKILDLNSRITKLEENLENCKIELNKCQNDK